jgi:hypothetical protein
MGTCSYRMARRFAAGLATLGFVPALLAAGFTAGNLVVQRVGDGSAALSSAATRVFLVEMKVDGTPVATVALPTAVSGANRRLTTSGSATSEGYISLSQDGNYIVQVGYDADVGTLSVVGTATTAVNRVIGRTSISDRTIDTSTYFDTTAYSANNIRSAASTDGTEFWASGAGAGGVWYTLLGPQSASTVQVSTSVTNTRNINIFDGQLYASSASGAFRGVNAVGTGLPTTSGETITLLPGFDPSTSSPQSVYDFFFSNADTLYVADDRSVASGGGIQKWTFDGSTWSLAYTMATAPGGSVRGLHGYVDATNGGSVVLFATTTETNANRVVTVTDTGAASAFTTIATAPTNTAFRGVRYLPVPDAPPGCPGDLDGDGDVDQSDLGILLANYGCVARKPARLCAGDLDGDGDTDQSDLGVLLANYDCVPR